MAFKTYYMLTKPGIILGNIITTASGFALASKGHFDLILFLATLIGLGFVIASAGVFNNYIDRAIDAKMERTKDRALAKGSIPTKNAIVFGTILGMIGISVLAFFTNLLTVAVTASGFFIYLVLYAILKYKTFYGTLVGSLAGAVPPVVGYCAVSDRLDMGALILFMLLVLWQMPHFFAIAIYRFNDYCIAAIPVLPAIKGFQITKVQMVFYIVAFFLTSLLLTFFGYTGTLYAMTTTLLSLVWLKLCLSGMPLDKTQDIRWARQMFVCSLVVIMGICLIIPFDTVV